MFYSPHEITLYSQYIDTPLIRDMMRLIVAENVREWSYDARLLSESCFLYSYLVYGITSLIGIAGGIYCFVEAAKGLLPVGCAMVGLSIMNFLFLFV